MHVMFRLVGGMHPPLNPPLFTALPYCLTPPEDATMILLIIAITVFLILACGCVRTFLILTHRDIAKVNQKLYHILHKLRL